MNELWSSGLKTPEDLTKLCQWIPNFQVGVSAQSSMLRARKSELIGKTL